MRDLVSQMWLELAVAGAVAILVLVLGLRKLMYMYGGACAVQRQAAGSRVRAGAVRFMAYARRWASSAIWWYVTVIALAWFMVAPVLRDPRLSILDCANVYRSYPKIRVLQPETWLNVVNDPTHARPGEVLVHLPAFWSFSARAQYWHLNGVMLTASMLIIFHLMRHLGRSSLLAFGTVLACLTTPSFVENFYTLGKCEPFITAGALGVFWVLYMLLSRSTLPSQALWLIVVPVGVYTALLATTPKETAIAFGGIYLVAWGLLLWATPLSFGKAVLRSGWLTLVVACGFSALLTRYLIIPRKYDQGETAVYSFDWANLSRGAAYIARYYWQTTPALVMAVFVTIGTLCFAGRGLMRKDRRCQLAWLLVFGCMWLGYAAIYVPWSSPQVRYFLPSDVAVRVAIMLTLSVAWTSVSDVTSRWYIWTQRVLTIIIVLLMAAHAVFTILVGHVSEGRARQQFDVAYDEMFKYIAAHTPRGGTAYFMYDREHEESRYNTRFGMPLFYGRPDINCVFPQSSQEFTTPGLVAVAHSAVSYNPNRMPVHAGAAALFNQRIAAEKNFVEVTNITINVPLWFVDARAYRGFQYRTYAGVPAFWALQRGTYKFGWTIYSYAPSPQRPNLIRNHDFKRGMQHWELWGRPCDTANTVVVVNAALRITNPSGEMRGVKQHLSAPLVSGQVYRLSATARLVGVPDVNRILGGRVAVYLPPQPEYDVTWLTQRDQWWQQERIFTNTVDGNPIVLVHLGYGHVATTAEFTDIVLEQLSP